MGVFCCFLGAFHIDEVRAQRVFSGVVQDAETGETLPAVTLQVVETGGGTITNAVGMYELDVRQLPTTVLIRHIGYETLQIRLEETSPSAQTIRLSPVAYELGELVVTDEDPAYNIMRKVIERKQQDRQFMEAYQAQTYSRFMLYSDFELAQLQETIANHYWLPDQGTRSLIRARRTRPARSNRFRFASTQYVPDFYDDTIHLLGLELIGPTHPSALDVYKFTLGGYRSIDGKRVYDIYFGPHSGLSTALIGHISVLDEEYVMLEINARPSPDNVLPAPIKTWDAQYQQQFAAHGDSVWLPVDLHVEGSLTFGRLGVSYPSAQYKQVSRLTQYVINVPPPDSTFLREEWVQFEPNVDRQDYLFRWNPGLIPMTPAEIEEVVEMDPKKGLHRHFRPIGVLSGYTAIDLEEDRDGVETVRRSSLVEQVFSGLALKYNRVEGLYLGLQRDLSLSRNLKLNGYGGYSFSVEDPSYGGAIQYSWGVLNAPSFFPNRGFARVGIDERYATQYASRTYGPFVNSVTYYVGWEDYFDYYRQSRQFVEAGFAAERLKTKVTAGLSRETHGSANKTIDDKGRFFGGRPRENPPVVEGDVEVLYGIVEVGEVPEVQMKAGGNGIRFMVEHQLDAGGIADPFTRYEVHGALTLPTFYKRRSWPNALHLRFLGATYEGSLPVQYASALDIARPPIAPFGAFKTLSGLPPKGGNVWSVFWEHDFSTTLFEYLGLWQIAKSGLGVTIHGAHGRAIPAKGFTSIDTSSLFDQTTHHEWGMSLTQLFNLPVRFDVTRNVNDRRFYFGIGITKQF